MMEQKNRLFEHYTEEALKLESAYTRLQEQFYELKSHLEASYQTLQKIIHHISEGLIFIQNNGEIALFNPEAARLTDLTWSSVQKGNYWNHFSDDFFGFSMRETLHYPLQSAAIHRRIFLTLGNDRDIEVSTSLIPNQGIVLMLSDRSEQQKLQNSLQQAERLKELGEMAATLAHEIRNPLGGIEGFARLLKRDLAGHDHQKMVNAILEGAQTLNHLVTSVLDYARPMQLHFAPADLIVLIHETFALMQASDTKTSYKLTTPISSYLIAIDKARIKLVLLNLLKNASEAGATVVHVELYETGELIVKDNGCGMSSEELRRVFTPFFTTKSRGNGLGLAESLAVIKAHGGRIELASKEKEGTKIHIYLCA